MSNSNTEDVYTSEDLKLLLKELRTERMIKFSNTRYAEISGDLYLECIPERLFKLWYSNNSLSFVTLAKDNTKIEYMSDEEVIDFIFKEKELLDALNSEFNKAMKRNELRGK